MTALAINELHRRAAENPSLDPIDIWMESLDTVEQCDFAEAWVNSVAAPYIRLGYFAHELNLRFHGFLPDNIPVLTSFPKEPLSPRQLFKRRCLRWLHLIPPVATELRFVA